MSDEQDLYRLLGVDRDADTATIRKAYRRAAKRWHPDIAGGDAAKFQELEFAHQLLTDPDRRAKYDATGEIDSKEADNVVSSLITNLSLIFNQAVAGLLSRSREPDQADLLDAMKIQLADARAKAEAQLGAFEKGQRRLERMSGKFTAPEGKANHLETIIHGQMVDLDGKIRQVRRVVEDFRAATIYLDGCKYKYGADQAFGRITLNVNGESYGLSGLADE